MGQRSPGSPRSAAYDVCVTFRDDAGRADRVADTIRAAGRRALAVQADVGREAEVERLFAEVDRALGP